MSFWLREYLYLAGIEIVPGGGDRQFPCFSGVYKERLRSANLLCDKQRIGANDFVDAVSIRRANRRHRGLEGANQTREMSGSFASGNGCAHGAASFMAEHHHQPHAKMFDGVPDAGKHVEE